MGLLSLEKASDLKESVESQGIWLGHSIGLTMENGQKKMTV